MKSRIRTRRARRAALIDAAPIHAAVSKAIETLESRQMLAVSMGSDGYTVVTPSSDTRTIYVSSSTGDDTKNGSSPAEAVKSITKGVSLLRSGSPDHLRLKKGDTFTSGFGGWTKSGRNPQEPMLISSYGTGNERPYLKTGTGAGFQSSTAFHDVAIIGLRFEAHTRNPDSPDFQGSAGKYGLHAVGPINGLLVEDTSFSHYVYNASITGFSGYAKNVQIRRSAFTDSWTNNSKAVGFYSSNTEGMLLEQNIFDHNGWNEDPDAVGGMLHPSHNVYLWESTRDPVIRGNIFARGGQHGLQARGGGTIENNVFLKNPIALLVGNGSTVRAGGVVAKVSGNVFLDSRDMNGSPRGWAIELGNIKPGGGSYVRDNIIANDTQLKHTAITLQTATSATNASEGVGINDLTIEKNIIYDWYQGISIASGYVIGGSGQTGFNDVVVRDNDFQKTASQRVIYHPQPYNAAEETWEDNDYHNTLSSSGWFYLGGKTTSFASWDSTVEPTADAAKQTYPDAERDIASYSKSLGGDGTLNGFMSAVREQRKGSWLEKFTAQAIVAYIRAGFIAATSEPTPTPTPTPTPEPEPTPTPTPPPPEPVANIAPTATLAASDRTAAGTSAHEIQITYADVDGKINATTVGNGDLTIVGPSGETLTATFVTIDRTYDGPTRVAKYAVAAPGGAWDSGDNGTYTVKMNASAVRDLQVAYVAAGTLGTFKANVATASEPDVPMPTPTPTPTPAPTPMPTPEPAPAPVPAIDATPPTVLWSNFNPADRTITVKFSEDVSRSLNTGDLRLKNLADSSLITYANMTMTYDRATDVAKWSVNTDLANVTYKVMLSWSVVSDAAGNQLDGNDDGAAGPDHVMYVAASEIAGINAVATADAA